MRPGDTARAGDTIQAGGDTAATAAVSDVVLAPGYIIDLSGKKCTIEKRIKISGEAIVYTVKIDDKPFIFKHYKPNTQLSDTAREVISRIKNSPHDRIVKVIDFGKYNNQDYEILELAEGGTLGDYLKKSAIRDAEQFAKIIKIINEGLQQLHTQYNVIYQDLKPDNIFFSDAKKTEMVLADFGISSVMETGTKKAQVVASLTDLYGAFELSPKTGRKHVIATPAVDYYSLGITILEMWLGEKPFMNIPPIERDYMISEGNIDFPADMPDDYKTLIQGLIKYNRNERWGYDQIQQWLSGKQLQSSGKASTGFATEMFNDTENFSSPKELADLMVKYPDQGAKILYSGIVESWFRKSGKELRAEEIKEVLATNAQDKQSGYYTAIYKIDPTRAWTSKGGKACTNLEEIAQALSSESAYYMEDLKKTNARLYLYLAAVEGANGVEASENFCKYFTEYKPALALAIICLKLQGDCITIGSKKYQSPEELKQEKDTAQQELINKSVMEDHSTLLVWLSSFYKDYLPVTVGFKAQMVPQKFFLINLLPDFSYKKFDPKWQTNALTILKLLIDESLGRSDLFEAYAAQGLPFNGEIPGLNVSPLEYVISRYFDFGIDIALNLVRLLVKFGADINEKRKNFLNETADGGRIELARLLIELGYTDKNKAKVAYETAIYRHILSGHSLRPWIELLKPYAKMNIFDKAALIPWIIRWRYWAYTFHKKKK
jgi:serine/threonine protein kinase